MKSVLAATAAVALTLSAAPAAMAAHAGAPYRNVDHSNDAGNDTGDAQVDQLNNAQLDQNYTGPRYVLPPPGSGAAAPSPGATPYAGDSSQQGSTEPRATRRTMRHPMHRMSHPSQSQPSQSQ